MNALSNFVCGDFLIAADTIISCCVTEQSKTGLGCFGRGCLVILLGSIAVALIAGGGIVFVYDKAVDRFTSAHPVDVRVARHDQNSLQIAKLTLDRLRAALAQNREETIEFTAADLNALVADHSDFAGVRGRVYFGIADSAMTLELNAPLETLPWPRLKGRWFNGTLRFTMDYEYGQFTFGPKVIRSRQWQVPDWFLTSNFGSSFVRGFNTGFTKDFNRSMQKDPLSATFWNHIKRITIDRDKLVVTTQHTE